MNSVAVDTREKSLCVLSTSVGYVVSGGAGAIQLEIFYGHDSIFYITMYIAMKQ